MPTIFEQEGYRFFFYSNDPEPIHVHVRRGAGEAVFVIEEEVALRESAGFKVQELACESTTACRAEQAPYHRALA